MWRRLLRDDKHKTSPARRCSFLLKGIGLCLESPGAETRQACDLEGAGAGARQLSIFQNDKTSHSVKKYKKIEKNLKHFCNVIRLNRCKKNIFIKNSSYYI
ncbi:hypothetical protein C1N70_00265 [Cytobacillus firmus]